MKLLYSFLKDMRLSLQGMYFYIELIMALIFIAVLIYVVPENFEPKITIFAHMDLPPALAEVVDESLGDEGYRFTMVESRDEVVERLEKNKRAVGLSISREGATFVYEYILQGYENEKLRNIMRESVESHFASSVPGYTDVTTVETIGENTEKLSSRLNMLPVYLGLNAAFMGLFIIASYVFLDKQEGTIKAFAVTPAKVWHYLAGKVGVLLVTGLTTGLLVTLVLGGGKPNYLHLIMLLLSCNAFGSALGLFIASFFDTMTKAMGWLYMTVIVFAFAAISYYTPAFSPLAIRLLPSYPMLFAFREAFLDNADIGYIYKTVSGFAAATVVFFLLANMRFKRTLTV
jgi:hypothetical protein